MKKKIIGVLLAGTLTVGVAADYLKHKEYNQEKIKITKENEEFKIKSIELEKHIEGLNENIRSLNENIRSLNEEKDELIKENEKLRKEVEAAKEKAASLGTKINVELTGYCNCSICSDNWGGITAMGTNTRVGVVAAPTEIPLGSTLFIPGLTPYKSDGIFDVQDRGGAVKRKADGTYIIDVWFPTHEQALEFGRRNMVAYLK